MSLPESYGSNVAGHDFFEGQADSDYYQSASVFVDKITIKVYVEAFDDVVLWEKALTCAADKSQVVAEFDISAIGDLTGSDGKNKVLQQSAAAGPHLLLCVDSDYDFIAEGYREKSILINRHAYIFQTYCCSLENFFCEPTQLPYLFSQATKCTPIEDEPSIITIFRQIGEAALEPMLMMLFLLKHDTSNFVFADHQQRLLAALSFVGVTQDITDKLDDLNKQMARLKTDLLAGFGDHFDQQFEHWQHEMQVIFSAQWHLMLRGHDLFDKIVIPLARQICRARVGKMYQGFELRTGTDKNEKRKQYQATIIEPVELIKRRTDFERTPVFDFIVQNLCDFFAKDHG